MTVQDLSEFSWISPDEVHLVGKGANGFPAPLLAKMALEVDAAGEALVKEFVDGLCGAEGGCSVCKERLESLSEIQVAKAKMDAKERGSLGSKDFAFPKQRKEPLSDAAHVRNAMARFDQVQDVSDKDRKRAARRIVGRAKHFGIEVSEDSSVAQAAKQTAPDKSVPESEAESQTRQHVEGTDPATGVSPEPEDGGKPASVPGVDVRPSETTGQGTTAPDKVLPVDEARSQTQKSTVDMTGTVAPEGDAAAADAKREAQTQTEETHATEKAGGSENPGSEAWEHKDVALGENAERLVAELGEVVHTFTEREKAEGASKSTRRTLSRVRYLLGNTDLLKECTDMSATELLAKLDERDAARRAEKKEAKKEARKAKAKKREKKAAEAAEMAAKAAGETAADERVEQAVKAANEAKELAEKIAAEDGRRIALNEAGVVAVLRDAEKSPSVFKALEDEVAAAEAQLEKAIAAAPRDADGGVIADAATQRASAELRQARQRRDTAKMIAQENARATDPEMLLRRMDGRGVPLFKNRHELAEDSDLRYQEGRRRA